MIFLNLFIEFIFWIEFLFLPIYHCGDNDYHRGGKYLPPRW
jgi:hypothetical protein